MTFEGAVLTRSRRSGAVALGSLAVIAASLVLAAFESPLAAVGVYVLYPLAISLAD